MLMKVKMYNKKIKNNTRIIFHIFSIHPLSGLQLIKTGHHRFFFKTCQVIISARLRKAALLTLHGTGNPAYTSAVLTSARICV